MRINPIEFDYDEIFNNCTNSIDNKKKRKSRILGYKNIIDSNNESYSVCSSKNVEFKSDYSPFNFEKLSADMIWLYDNKFSKKESPGRKYYNDIKLSTPNERCPYCLWHTVKEVDHYLPKSVVPVLSITPQNLVPVCKDCNFQKGHSEELIPNPYFDNLDSETYLTCSIRIVEDVLVFNYGIIKPINMDSSIFKKLENLFNQINIFHDYSNLAQDKFNDDIVLIKDYINSKTLFFRSLNALIKGRKNGFKKNTWEYAYYNALKENYDLIVDYLN